MPTFKTGDAVRKAIPDIVGTVIGARVNDDSGFLYLVEFTDADGVVQQRTFGADELEAEPAPAPADPAPAQ